MKMYPHSRLAALIAVYLDSFSCVNTATFIYFPFLNWFNLILERTVILVKCCFNKCISKLIKRL